MGSVSLFAPFMSLPRGTLGRLSRYSKTSAYFVMPSCQSPATTAGVIMLQCSGFVTLARSPEAANRLTEMEATPRGSGSYMEDGLVPPKDSLALSLANKRSLPWVHAVCTATGHRHRRHGPAPENGHLTELHERKAQTSNSWCHPPAKSLWHRREI